jgi:hypothetical protein
MLREQEIPLPRVVIERALEQQTDPTFANLIEKALSLILNGSSGDRFRLMQAALPVTAQEDQIFRYPCTVNSHQFREFTEFCHSKTLNSTILITGALMLELGMIEDWQESTAQHQGAEPPLH